MLLQYYASYAENQNGSEVREKFFYGDADFIFSKAHTLKDAKKAISIAEKFVNMLEKIT